MRFFGQMSVEFLIIFSVIVFSFLILTIIYQGQTINTKQSIENLKTKKSQHLANAINYVYLAGDGTSYNFTFKKLSSENITINNGILEYRSGDGISQVALLTNDINTSKINNSSITIHNKRGGIEIEE